MYEDWRGDIWIGTIYPLKFAIARWNRQTGKFEDFSDAPARALPPPHPSKRFISTTREASGPRPH
jgi:hypothetical protein